MKGQVSPDLDAVVLTSTLLKSNLDAAERLAVAEIARHGSHGFPSDKEIAGTVGVDERTARRIVKRLKAKGWVRVEKRFDANGKQLTNHYILGRPGLTPQVGRTNCPPPPPDKLSPSILREDTLNTSSGTELKPKEEEVRVPRESAVHASRSKKWTPEQVKMAHTLTKAFRDTVTVRRPGESPPADTFGRDLKFWLMILVWLNREGFGEDHARGMAAKHIEYCVEKRQSISMVGFFARRELLHHEQIKAEENRRPASASKPSSFGLTYD